MRATETRSPQNQNFLQQDGFLFVIKKCPTAVFFTQKLSIPGLTIPPTEHPTPFVKIPIAGDHIEYEDLSFDFKVDEDLKNWNELYKWMTGQGYPEEHAEYKELAKQPKWSGDGLVSDISVIPTTNLKNPNVEIVFKDAFPMYLSGFDFEVTSDGVMYATATTTFKYLKFEINVLPK